MLLSQLPELVNPQPEELGPVSESYEVPTADRRFDLALARGLAVRRRGDWARDLAEFCARARPLRLQFAVT